MTMEERVKHLVAARRLSEAIENDHDLASGSARELLLEASDAATAIVSSLEDSLIETPIASPRDSVFAALVLAEHCAAEAKGEELYHQRASSLAERLLDYIARQNGIDVASFGLREVQKRPSSH